MACIFVSYRRADNAAGYSRSLARALRREFGDDQVFRDIRSIPPGEDFGDFIERTLRDCRVMLVLIGTHWANIADAAGRRRLENPDDWVRREVSAALSHDILVIPVLVCGAGMPAEDELPDDLAALAGRNAVTMSDDDWEHDVAQLVRALRDHLGLNASSTTDTAPARSLAQILADTAASLRTPRRQTPSLGQRLLWGLGRFVRNVAFVALLIWIGYTQNDTFAAGVDRFFVRSADMLAKLMP